MLGAVNGVVVTPSAFCPRTSAGSQMLAEGRQIDLGECSALLVHEMAKMSRRPQIAQGGGGTITVLLEQGGEPVQIRTARPTPQMPKHLRC